MKHNVKASNTDGVDHDEDRRLLFDYAFEAAPIGIALVDTLGRVLRANDSFSRIVGLSSSELDSKPFQDFTHPEDLNIDLELFGEVLDGRRNGYRLEKRYLKPDGTVVPTMLTVTAMRNPQGQVIRFISQIEDMTEQKRAERQLAERAAQLELAMEAIRGGFWHMDVESLRFETSAKLAEFIGGPGTPPLDLQGYLDHIEVRDRAGATLAPLVEGKVDQSVAEYRLDTSRGERWMRCDRRLLRDPKGNPLRIVGAVIDFTDEHNRLQQLETSAETDALTALLNRRGLLKHFLKSTFVSGCGLLTVDLDGFKAVNDLHGHAAGDGVLIETANRLISAVGKQGVVSRMGGDEFVIAVDVAQAAFEDIAARIVTSLARPILLPEASVIARASVGGAWSFQKPASLESFAKIADMQLYEAKAAGKNTWRIKAL
jgi:diguanylate cyclase (GGDEF)-like protein/PAS domain S-box-containing protein